MLINKLEYLLCSPLEKKLYDIATHKDSEACSRHGTRRYRSGYDALYVTTTFYKEDSNSMLVVDSVSHFEVSMDDNHWEVKVTGLDDVKVVSNVSDRIHRMLWRIVRRNELNAAAIAEYHRWRHVDEKINIIVDSLGKVK
jgi:hypothetical protein